MSRGLGILVLLVTLSLLAAGGLAAQEPPRREPMRLVPNRVIVDPGPGQDWASYELDLGQIAVPAAVPRPRRTAVAGQWDYVVYDALIVIYSNTAAGSIGPDHVARVKDQVRTARDFFWRNSHFTFFLNLQWLVIDTYVDASEFKTPASWGGCSWLWPDDSMDGDGESPAVDIAAHGLNPGDFDSINLLWAHNGGSLGACSGGLCWLNGWAWPDGAHTAITTNALIYAQGDDVWNPFHHEFQHSIDGAFALNGNEGYFHADYPWRETQRFGDNWHFHSVQMRAWPQSDWFDLVGEWGAYATAPDADGDGLPDSGALPVTEATLGSSAAKVDSDKDGRSDRDEAMAGMFRAGDALLPDSDGDGLTDDVDAYPLYPLKTYIPAKTQVINGNPAGWALLTDMVMEADVPLDAEVYGNWKNGTLYLMVITDRHARIDIMLDGNADGYYRGRDNYHFELNTSLTGSSGPLDYAGVLDCSAQQTSTKGYCQFDTEASYLYSRLVNLADFQAVAVDDGGRHIVQLAVPADADTGFNPRYGQEIGLRLFFKRIDNIWLREAWTFEIDEQVYLPLLTADTGTLRGTVRGLGVCDEGLEPLSGAEIKIEGTSGPTRYVETNPAGQYSIKLPAAEGPYTLTAVAGGYITAVAGSVEVVPQGETVQDFTLQRDAPCLAVQPPAVAEQLRLGEAVTKKLTVGNTGAGQAGVIMQLTDFQLPVMTWVSVDPITATIPAGGLLSLDLLLDARPGALDDPGLYEATLLIQESGPTFQQLSVPVSLHAVTYGVILEAEEPFRSGVPGAQVPYTLLLTNVGSTTDTFELAASGAWDVTLPPTAGPLAAGQQQEIIVNVAIPAGAPPDSHEVTAVTAVSRAAPDQSAMTELETVVAEYRLLLPLIRRQ